MGDIFVCFFLICDSLNAEQTFLWGSAYCLIVCTVYLASPTKLVCKVLNLAELVMIIVILPVSYRSSIACNGRLNFRRNLWGIFAIRSYKYAWEIFQVIECYA